MIDYGFGVSLGPVDRAHLERMRAWRNDPRIFSWCRQNGQISDLDQERWFEKQNSDPSIRMFLIYGESQTLPIGVCGLTSIDLVNRRAEFSLYIAPDKQQMGFGRAALKTLLHWGFKMLGLNIIWGETYEGNPARSLFESLGFKYEGTRREFYYRDGKFTDAHLLSLRSDEWPY